MNQGFSRGLTKPGWSWGQSPHRAALLVVVILTLGRVVYLNLDLFPLFGDEAQYWSWSLAPAFGYYSKPPMVAWIIAATTALAGAGEPAVKLASPLAHAVTALMIYLIGCHLGGRRVGVWSCLLYITMPAVSYSCAIISTDPLLLMFWSMALYGFTQATEANDRHDARLTNRGAHGGNSPHPVRGGKIRWWLLTGFGLGLALLSKYTAVAFAISAFLYIATTSGRRALLRSPGPFLAVATALLIFSPNLMWNAEHDFVSLVHVGDNAHWTGDLFNFDRLAEFVLAQLGVFGPLPFACLVAMIVRWKNLVHHQAVNLLLWFTAPLLAAICIQALVSRAYANWAAPIYVAASVAVAIRLLDLGKERWLAATIAVNLALGLALASYEPLVRGLDLPVPARFDLLKRVRGWPEMGQMLERLRQENPGTLLLVDDRMLMAQCLYYGAVPVSSAYSWNPKGLVRHHYDLVSDMNDALGRDFLFVSGAPDLLTLKDCFAGTVTLSPIDVRTHPDRTLHFFVYRLNRFRGYQWCD